MEDIGLIWRAALYTFFVLKLICSAKRGFTTEAQRLSLKIGGGLLKRKQKQACPVLFPRPSFSQGVGIENLVDRILSELRRQEDQQQGIKVFSVLSVSGGEKFSWLAALRSLGFVLAFTLCSMLLAACGVPDEPSF